MTINAIFYIIAAVLYLVSAWGIYSSARELDPKPKTWVRPAVGLGLIIQAYLIYEALFTHGTPHFGLALALSITLFSCTAILFVESFFTRIGTLLMFVLPLGAAGMLLPLAMPGTPLGPETASFTFRMHLLLAILSYSLMTLAMIQALMLTALQKWLRDGSINEECEEGKVSILQNVPSLIEMENVLFRMLWSGFLILTAAVVFGALYTFNLYDTPFRFDHKTVTTIIAWVIFGVLLWGHHIKGWRGRFAARWVVVGFCMLMIAYIGVRLVVEVAG